MSSQSQTPPQKQIALDAARAHCDLEATLAALPDTWLLLNTNLEIESAHSPQECSLAYLIAGTIGRRIIEILAEPAKSIFNEAISQANLHRCVQRIELSVEIDGELRHYECSVAAKTSKISHIVGYVIILREISDWKVALDQVALLSHHDPLTGLLNRRALLERLTWLSIGCAARSTGYAVLLVDLDHFKDLNDSHGHSFGDELLRQVAQRIGAELRPTDLLARAGGDEFLIVVADLPLNGDSRHVAELVAIRVSACIRRRFDLSGLVYEIGCSIGIAFGGGEGGGESEVGNVLKSADIALYQAKASGRNATYFCDQKIHAAITARSSLEQDLRMALERQELELFYQPIVDRTRSVVGYEALVRWNHPSRGLVPPIDFIPAAEYNGLIVAIGDWVMEQAALCLMDWQRAGINREIYISVNVSSRQVREVGFVEKIERVLRHTGVSAELLRIELTESLMHEDLEVTIRVMHRLRELGVDFALDDFGTGYSSMAYLRRLPLQQIKIDRSFVAGLPQDCEGSAIVHMILQLAQTLHMSVVAEGIETEAQLDYLMSIGCQYFQGYLLGRPAPMPRAGLANTP